MGEIYIIDGIRLRQAKTKHKLLNQNGKASGEKNIPSELHKYA